MLICIELGDIAPIEWRVHLELDFEPGALDAIGAEVRRLSELALRATGRRSRPSSFASRSYCRPVISCCSWASPTSWPGVPTDTRGIPASLSMTTSSAARDICAAVDLQLAGTGAVRKRRRFILGARGRGARGGSIVRFMFGVPDEGREPLRVHPAAIIRLAFVCRVSCSVSTGAIK